MLTDQDQVQGQAQEDNIAVEPAETQVTDAVPSPEAPAVETSTTAPTSFDSQEALDAYIATRSAADVDYFGKHQEWPENAVKAEETPVEKPTEAIEPNTQADESKPDEAEPEPFKFTENADAETFAKEKTAWLETVDISPELQTVLDNESRLRTELQAKIEANPLLSDETAGEHMEAFNTLVRTKFDSELQMQVPDTSGVIGLLEKHYPQELPRVVEDLNAQPSPKYPGLTRMQEYIKDAFDLTPQAMQHLNYFLQNNGQLPVPSYVPYGIKETLADAFWSADDRLALQEQIEGAQYVLADTEAIEQEKDQARQILRGINNRLQREQDGINASRQGRDAENAQIQKERQAVYADGEKAFYETSSELLSQFTDKLSKALPMLDEAGSGLVGLSTATLVEKALTDDPYHSKFAQDKLAKMGINFDFKRGRQALDELWDTELLIATQKRQNANERAIQMSLRNKDRIIKTLENLETELSGKIVARVVNGNAAQMQKKMAAAPKTQAIKPKTVGEATSTPTKLDFDKMAADGTLDAWMAQNKQAVMQARGY